jgi:protease-4
MRFVGKAWRLLVGIKDGLVLILMMMFFGIIYAALSASPYKDSAREGALRLDLGGAIVEQPSARDPLAALGGGPVTREYRVAELVRALDAAAADSRIRAIALDLDIFIGGGQTAIADVGAALDRARRAGKRVVAYATGYTDDSYQLAAHADEIWLDPMGVVLIAGPGGSNLYYAGLLERIGVTAHVYRVGAFKSAVEPYTRSDMSPESRAQSQALADALWGTWRADVGNARPRAQIAAWAANPQAFIDASGGDMARAALRAGLIDRIGDRTQFGRRMAELAGNDDERVPGRYNAVHYEAWIDEHSLGHDGEIGILTVAGTIVDGEAGPGTAGGETIARNLERGLASGSLKALVVRIDSPGGSVLASERIRRAVLAAKARGLPVVISMGSVAASGGYWVATAGDVIYAEPSTITGSIGVFGILPSFEGTLRRLGIGVDGVRTTPLSGEPDLLRGPSPEAERLLQTGVEGIYRRFIGLVARARRLTPARVEEIAQGRVWNGGTARQLGLVDRFGSLNDAVADAARRAGLDPATARVAYLESGPGFFARLFGGLGRGNVAGAPRDAFSRLARRPEAMIERAVHDAQSLLAGPAIQARCLECPAIAPVPRPPAEGHWLARLAALVLSG